jgi:two-component system, chemotaxis family, CheB/CheR fusion protein
MPEYPLESPEYGRVLALLRATCGLDFTAYRSPTVVRRIENRMLMTGMPTLTAYAGLVERDPEELAQLISAILIKTTSMFRDADVFTALRDRVLPALVSRRAREGVRTLSAWVVGCSTGEEAYSMGMCLLEAGEKVASPMDFVMVASDVDADVLERAARGVLTLEQAGPVPEPLANRWLLRHEGGYRISEELRELIVFTRHDLLDPHRRSPPASTFASFDLVCCRNVLIYLGKDARARALKRLVDVCEPGSILVLGESETLPQPLAARFFSLAPPTAIFGLR